jgi:predicted component of type VI protein secretion system
MPIARYFLFVGGVLLALLFGVDAFAPKDPAVSSIAAAAAPDANPTLRIRSDRKWPERVVYDTSLPTIVPPQLEVAAAAVATAPVAEMPAKASVRESFAQSKPADDPKPQAKPLAKRKVAKVRTAPPSQSAMRVAQQPQFGFFASNIW